MTINLETLPALFAEIGDKADTADLRRLVKALAGRCALFAGVMGKMGAHVAELEAKIAALTPATPKPEAEAKVDDDEKEEEAASSDLDAEVAALAAKLNGGAPAEVVEPTLQKGALT